MLLARYWVLLTRRSTLERGWWDPPVSRWSSRRRPRGLRDSGTGLQQEEHDVGQGNVAGQKFCYAAENDSRKASLNWYNTSGHLVTDSWFRKLNYLLRYLLVTQNQIYLNRGRQSTKSLPFCNVKSLDGPTQQIIWYRWFMQLILKSKKN